MNRIFAPLVGFKEGQKTEGKFEYFLSNFNYFLGYDSTQLKEEEELEKTKLSESRKFQSSYPMHFRIGYKSIIFILLKNNSMQRVQFAYELLCNVY